MSTIPIVCVCALCDPWTIAPQAPLSMKFPRQEYWSGLSFPPSGDLPNPGIEPMSRLSRIGRCILYHCATGEAPYLQLLTTKTLVSIHHLPPLPISLSPTSLSLFSYPPLCSRNLCICFCLIWFIHLVFNYPTEE